jgi:hypothetical protein
MSAGSWPRRFSNSPALIVAASVTAGIDLALTVLAEVAGDEMAQLIQLGFEYALAPPFDAGRPERAPVAVRERFQALSKKFMDVRRGEAEQAARMLDGGGGAVLLSAIRSRAPRVLWRPTRRPAWYDIRRQRCASLVAVGREVTHGRQISKIQEQEQAAKRRREGQEGCGGRQ